MFSLFETLAFAFVIALSLYEAVQAVLAFNHAFTVPHQIRWDPRTNRQVIDERASPLSGEARMTMFRMRYCDRSLVLHQVHYWMCGEEAQFKSLPYLVIGAIGTLLFSATGAVPFAAAAGMGIAGALTAFVSQQARNLVCHSDALSDYDDEETNLRVRLAMARAA